MTSRHELIGALLLSLAISAACGNGAPEGTTVERASGSAGSATDQNSKAAAPASGVFINEHELSREQIEQLVAIYRLPPPRGHFWYDTKNGLYGQWGRESAGYLRPGHDFGPLPENASNGHTGVFIDGRQLSDTEVAFLQILFNGQVRR